MFGDSLLAGLLALFDLLLFLGRAVSPGDEPRPWYLTFTIILGVVVPLVFRRKYPIPAAWIILFVSIP